MAITVKGTNGTITADDEKVTISRKSFVGFIMQGVKGDRIIFYKDVKSIEYKKPSLLINGYIQFITNAELATEGKINLLGGSSKEAMKDPNLVILQGYKKKMVNGGQELYEFVLKKLDEYKQDHPQNEHYSSADEITKFKRLLDEGAITQDEFDKKKNELLNL